MSPQSQGQGVNIRAALAVAAVSLIGIALLAFLSSRGGPVSRCKTRGGHFIVGPAGVSACIDPDTFLPTIDLDEAGKPL